MAWCLLGPKPSSESMFGLFLIGRISEFVNKILKVPFREIILKVYLKCHCHDNDVMMSAIFKMASQITSLAIVYATVYSGADEHQSSAPLAFVWGVQRWPVNSPHKGPVTQKVFPFYDVIMVANPMCYPQYLWDTIIYKIYIMEKVTIGFGWYTMICDNKSKAR